MKRVVLLKRRLLALLAIICMMAAIAPVNLVMATDVIANGQMGDNVFWTIDANRLMTVEGTGPIWNYDEPWNHKWNGQNSVNNLVITDGITSIGSYAFGAEFSLKNVEIADSVTTIKNGAFWCDKELISIKLPDSLTVIESYAFSSCEKLASITLPNTVKKIENGAFCSCKGLTHVAIPNQVKIIDESTFADCINLKSINIPIAVTKINDGAFYGCPALTDVYYAGTKAQWDKIQIDYSDNGNDALLSATIHYGAVEESAPSSWAKAEVDAAIQAGLVPTNLQQNYQEPISRGDVAGMFVNLIEKTSGKSIDAVMEEKGVSINPNAFTDTTDKAVLAANALGIINGTGNGKFSPDSTLTRAQIAAIINRVATVLGVNTAGYSHQFTDVSGHWVSSELGWPSSVGIINGVGDNKFSPDTELTTEQAIAITYRAFNTLAKP